MSLTKTSFLDVEYDGVFVRKVSISGFKYVWVRFGSFLDFVQNRSENRDFWPFGGSGVVILEGAGFWTLERRNVVGGRWGVIGSIKRREKGEEKKFVRA